MIPYDPDAPIDPQPDSFSCSLQATQWLLRSIGRNPDASDPQGDPWLRSQLVPAIVSPNVGLRDASGGPLARWLTETYGVEMSFVAHAAPVSFDDVAAGAGRNPTLIGGRSWNHWAGVRRLNADGTLAIANSAPGWGGIDDRMSREQFQRLGPFTAVWIDRILMQPPAPEPAPPARTRATIRAEIAALLDEMVEAPG